MVNEIADQVEGLISELLTKNPSQKDLLSALLLGAAGFVGAAAAGLNGGKHDSEEEYWNDIDIVCDSLKRHIKPRHS